MGVLDKLLFVFISLICIGIDIAVFFLLVRLVLMWRSISWLERLNDIGKNLVDALGAYAGRLWYRGTRKPLSEKGQLIVSLLALSIIRLVLCGIARLFSGSGT